MRKFYEYMGMSLQLFYTTHKCVCAGNLPDKEARLAFLNFEIARAKCS